MSCPLYRLISPYKSVSLAATTTTVLYIVDEYNRVVACGIVGLVLARIRVDTLVGAGACFFWPEFMVRFGTAIEIALFHQN